MFSELSEFLNRVLSVFSTFTIVDFFDIVLVALLIYVCVRIIRETRAMQFAKAIVFGVLIYAVVNLLGMETSTYVFQQIFANIILIIVVLFSPEIRNILEQIGKGATRKSISTIIHPGAAVTLAEIKDCIEAVTRACSDMSDTKTGALIVFENQTLLGDIIESGVLVNAHASTALIENIFFPKTPLHDGALVIRESKVYAAGCILPLTKKNVRSSLGTRHRAAIGLSEVSDAVVVVVSEETGEISVARKGKLQTDISDGDLRDILMNVFVNSGTSSDDKLFSRLAKKVKK